MAYGYEHVLSCYFFWHEVFLEMNFSYQAEDTENDLYFICVHSFDYISVEKRRNTIRTQLPNTQFGYTDFSLSTDPYLVQSE